MSTATSPPTIDHWSLNTTTGLCAFNQFALPPLLLDRHVTAFSLSPPHRGYISTDHWSINISDGPCCLILPPLSFRPTLPPRQAGHSLFFSNYPLERQCQNALFCHHLACSPTGYGLYCSHYTDNFVRSFVDGLIPWKYLLIYVKSMDMIGGSSLLGIWVGCFYSVYFALFVLYTCLE